MTAVRWRVVVLGVPLLLGALVLGLSCDGDGGEDVPTEGVDAATVLEQAAARTEALESFRFDLEFDGGGANIVGGVEMESAEGEFGGTENFSAKLRASVGPIDAELEIRMVDGVSWLTNPLTGRWEREDLSVASLFDLSTGVTALMRSVEAPAVTGAGTIDGASSYRIEADLRSEDLTLIPGARSGETLRATAWVGVDDSLVRLLEVRGALFVAGEEGAVTLRLSRFDEPVTIESPR